MVRRYFWGYSLAFSGTATNHFIGNLDAFGLMGVYGAPSPGSPLVPELLYSFYQVSLEESALQSLGLIASRILTYPSAAILCRHWCYCHWSYCRTWSPYSSARLHLPVGYDRLLSYRILGMGS